MTDAFSERWRALGKDGRGQQERKKVWYDNQHQHWVGWLREWNGPGAYGRKNSNRSAQFVYEHIVNPQMLVYLAEAAGIAPGRVRRAAREALANRFTMASMSAAIRRVIPWHLVEEALWRS